MSLESAFADCLSSIRSENARLWFNEPRPTYIRSSMVHGGSGMLRVLVASDKETSVESSLVSLLDFRTDQECRDALYDAFKQLVDRWNELHPKALPVFRFGPLRMGQPDAVEGCE